MKIKEGSIERYKSGKYKKQLSLSSYDIVKKLAGKKKLERQRGPMINLK